MTSRERLLRWTVAAALALAPFLLVWAWFPALAETTELSAAARLPPEVLKWGFLSAAIVTGASSLGAAYAVAVVGGAAVGAVAEKPEVAGRAIVFVGLAEGIAIYGLIIAIMILGALE